MPLRLLLILLAFMAFPGRTEAGEPRADAGSDTPPIRNPARVSETSRFTEGPTFAEIDPVERNLPSILESWKHRVDLNRGVHEWSRRHDGMRVWQEWIALMTIARRSTPEARRQTGLALQKYVVDGDIRPLGFIGTSLPVPGYDQGDFDMSLLGCTSLMGLFQDDRLLLTDATLIHLIKNVARTWGQTPKAFFDVVFVSVPETENHLFMTESSRFLTNQLIWENGRKLPQLIALRDSLIQSGEGMDNSQGSLKTLLLKVMQQTMRKGFFEFNAQIYQRFTIHALDNLYSFAHDSAMVDGAGCLLDYLSAVFAFQSYDAIRYGPFRRSSEVYDENGLIENDAACSFFGMQSGAFAWDPVSRRGLWHSHVAHASMALYSAVLRYRVPAPILAYMRDRPAEYRAEIRSAYAGKGSRRRATEIYYGSRHFLLTAGGRYETYAGPNFPTYRYWFSDAPWVYDVITRSGSLILDPRKERPSEVKDILHFRGSQWRANNMAIHRNFLYGYTPVDAFNSGEWPQQVPAGWPGPGETYVTRDFDFRFVDRSDAGVYVILSRLRPSKTYLKWGYQKYLRGAIEVIDTGKVASLDELRKRTLANNAPKARWPLGPRRYTYVDFSGARIQLNSRYDGEREGIVRVEEPSLITDSSRAPPVTLPFPYPWVGERPSEKTFPVLAGFLSGSEAGNPLFQVETTAPWKGKVALSDGLGNMYVFNPSTGGYCLSNFREWWNPRRKIVTGAAPGP
ncbi:MAG: hypothetical protein JWP91_1090 [Fibrobacteres bacterium]|nr:hypothetical protein [Fibrobacterota bacterium]